MEYNRLLHTLRVTAIAGVAAASLGVAGSAFAQIPNKTLVYCSEGSPAGFDSAQFTTGVDFTAATFTVYNRLVEFERGGTKVVPGLAEVALEVVGVGGVHREAPVGEMTRR